MKYCAKLKIILTSETTPEDWSDPSFLPNDLVHLACATQLVTVQAKILNEASPEITE